MNDQKKEVVVPSPQPQNVNRPDISKNRGYVRQSRGYPVQPGQTWHDLTPQQRREWMAQHEQRWRQQYGKQAANATGAPASMDWTRG